MISDHIVDHRPLGDFLHLGDCFMILNQDFSRILSPKIEDIAEKDQPILPGVEVLLADMPHEGLEEGIEVQVIACVACSPAFPAHIAAEVDIRDYYYHLDSPSIWNFGRNRL